MIDSLRIYAIAAMVILVVVAIYLIPTTVYFKKIADKDTVDIKIAKNYMYINIAMIIILALTAIVGIMAVFMSFRKVPVEAVVVAN